MTGFGRAVLVALVLAGVWIGGCSADEDTRAPAPSASQQTGAVGQRQEIAPGAISRVSQPVLTGPAASPKLMRVAPEHVRAVQQGLAQRLNHSGDGLRIESLSNGRKSIELEGRFGHVLIANRDETGKTQVTCAGSPEEVAKAMGH